MKKLSSILLALALCLSLVCGALAEQAPKALTPKDWDGSWNSVGAMLDVPEIQAAFEKVAQKKGVDASAVVANAASMLQASFQSIVVKNGVFSFYDALQTGDAPTGNVIAEVNYEAAGSAPEGWYRFASEADSPYKYFISFEPGVDEGEDMIHYHCRYSDGFDYLGRFDVSGLQYGWMPTLIKADTPAQELADVLVDVMGSMSYEAPTADVSLANWAGKWNNFTGYLSNEGVQEAYQIKADKDGKTLEETKDFYFNGPTYQCEIAAMSIEGDTISFYANPQKDGETQEPTATAQYAFQGMVKDANDREFAHIEAQGDAPYKTLLLLPAEADVPGETMMHFHFRYGDNADELLQKDGWYPTMIASDTTDDLIVGHMTH